MISNLQVLKRFVTLINECQHHPRLTIATCSLSFYHNFFNILINDSLITKDIFN